jgi:hypothetical protein
MDSMREHVETLDFLRIISALPENCSVSGEGRRIA